MLTSGMFVFYVFFRISSLVDPYNLYASWVLFSTAVWIGGILLMRYILRVLLMYTGWMYEPRNRMSLATKIWIVS